MKKILALLMSVLMLVGMSIPAFASEQMSGFLLNGKSYDTLSEAVSAAQNGDTINMMGDTTVSSTEGKITIDKNITVNGNGYTLTLEHAVADSATAGFGAIAVSSTVTFKNFKAVRSTSAATFEVNSNGKLTLSNLSAESKNFTCGYINNTVKNTSAELILDNATISSAVDASAKTNAAIINAYNGATVTLTAMNNSVISKNNASENTDYKNGNNYVIHAGINGSGTYNINLESGSRVIANAPTGSTAGISGFIEYGYSSWAGINVYAEDGTYFILNSAASTISKFFPFRRANAPSNIRVPHRGVLLREIPSSIDYGADGHHYLTSKSIGTMTLDNVEYSIYDYCQKIDKTYNHTQFGNVRTDYENDGDSQDKVVTLNGTYFFDAGNFTVHAGKTLVIDLNGNTMAASLCKTYLFNDIQGHLIIKNGKMDFPAGFVVKNGGKLTLENIEITVTPNPGYVESTGYNYSRPLIKLNGDGANSASDITSATVKDSTLTSKANGEMIAAIVEATNGTINLEGRTTLISDIHLRNGGAAHNAAVIGVQQATTGNKDNTNGTINVGKDVSLILTPSSDASSSALSPSVINDYTEGNVEINIEKGAHLRIERDTAMSTSTFFVREHKTEGTTTINDNGAIYSANAQSQKVGVILPELTREGKIFVCYGGDEKLYAGGKTYKNENASSDIIISPIFMDPSDFVMEAGAALRTSKDMGIRFTSKVSDALLDTFGRGNVSMGTIIANATLVGSEAPSLSLDFDSDAPEAILIPHEYRENRIADGYHYNRAAVIGFPDTASAYNLRLAARGFITLNLADGSSMTIYTDFNGADNIRSMYRVAYNLEKNDQANAVSSHIIKVVGNSADTETDNKDFYVVKESYMPTDVSEQLKNIFEDQTAKFNTFSYGSCPYVINDEFTISNGRLLSISIPVAKTLLADENGNFTFTMTVGNNEWTKLANKPYAVYTIRINANEYGLSESSTVNKWIKVDLTPYDIYLSDAQTVGFGNPADTLIPAYLGIGDSGNIAQVLINEKFPQIEGFISKMGTGQTISMVKGTLIFDFEWEKTYASEAAYNATIEAEKEYQKILAAVKEKYEGKTLSIMGDSISTYDGISNNTSYNSTIANNQSYYGVNNRGLYDINDTYWQRLINDLGMSLCVNNSWAGSTIRNSNTPSRAAELDNNDGVTPDVILLYMGINDLHYASEGQFGDLYAILSDPSDTRTDNEKITAWLTTFDSSTLTTFERSYSVVLKTFAQEYPDAEVWCLTLNHCEHSKHDAVVREQYNRCIVALANYYGVNVIDQSLGYINSDNCVKYSCDGYGLHPTAEGHALMEKHIVETFYDKIS